MESHNEITENQILKLNLDLLKSEQMQHYPESSVMIPSPNLRHVSQAHAIQHTPHSGTGSIIV